MPKQELCCQKYGEGGNDRILKRTLVSVLTVMGTTGGQNGLGGLPKIRATDFEWMPLYFEAIWLRKVILNSLLNS